jgi:hypothetical protein
MTPDPLLLSGSVSAEPKRLYVFKFRLADGTERVGRGWTSQSFTVGESLLYPMRADGTSRSGWRYFWRVSAIEEPNESAGVEGIVAFEFDRPDPAMDDVQA